MAVTLDGSGSTVTGGSGGLTVLDTVGGNTIIGGAGSANNGITVTTTTGNDLIETGWSTATNTIELGAGNDIVIANGTSNITGTTGNDTITVNEWTGAVVTSTGTSTVTFNTQGQVTTHGTDTVTSNAGTMVVNADGPSTTVYGGSGYMWFGGTGKATVYGGRGGGNFDFRSAAGDTLTTTRGATDTVWLGAGAATINSYGEDTVYAGSGKVTLIADIGATLELAGTSTTTTAGAVTANGTVDLAGGTLTSSSITVASGGELLGYGTVTSTVSNSGTVNVNGGDLHLKGGVTGSGALIDVSGNLYLYGANSAGAVTVGALVDVAGGTLTASKVTIASGGDLTGYGTVTAPVSNSGEIVAGGGTLKTAGAISGSGSLLTDGATLELAGTSSAGTVTDGGTLKLDGISLTATSVTVSTGKLLMGTGTIAAPVANSGTIEATGGMLAVNGVISGAGTLLALVGSTLVLEGNATAGEVTYNGTVGLDGIQMTATSVVGAGRLIGFGTVTATVTNSGMIEAYSGTFKFVDSISGDGKLIADRGAILELAGATTSGAVTDTGTVKLDGITLSPTSFTVAAGGHLIGYGTVGSAVANSGTIESNTSLLDVTGAVTGTGTLKIDAGETLEVGSTVASTQTAVFASATGTLSLDQPPNFAGSITNFTGSDQIYLGGQTITGFGGYNTTTHVLTVLGTGNATIAQLTFNGSYTLGNFSVSNNGLYILDSSVTAATTGGSSTPTFINASAGNEVVAFPAAGTGLDAISGFSLTNGDVLDFAAALKGTGWHGDLTQVGNFITAVANGSETDLYCDPTGQGHGALIAELGGVNTTVASLLAHHAIRVW
jgi:hypothetical protein